jgi:hypothetical protein
MEKEFDCVKFQRERRVQMLNEADNSLEQLFNNINNSLKNNDLYEFLKNRSMGKEVEKVN